MKDKIKKNLLGYGIYIVILILCIAFGYAILYITYENIKQKMIANLNERQLLHGRQAARGIVDFFESWTVTLTAYSRTDDIIDLNDKGKQLMAVLYGTSKEEIRAVTRVDAQGRIVYTTPMATEAIGKNISGQRHIREISRTHKPVVSDVFKAVQGFDTVALHIPVFRNKIYNGTIGIAIDFRALSKRYLENVKIGTAGYAWMVSRDGTELYCPVPGHVGNSVFDNCRDFPDILAMAHRMTGGEQGLTTYQFNRIRGDIVEKTVKHAIFLPVRLENTFWSIVVATPEEEVIGELTGFRNRLIFVAALLLVIVGGMVFMMFRNQLLLSEVARRKSAEEELQESQRRLADIIEFLPDATFVIDKKGTITAWNKAITNMTGVTAEEMIGKGNYEYTLPFYGDRRPALIDMVLKPDEMFLKDHYQSFVKQGDTLSAKIFVSGIKQGQGGDIWVTATKFYNTDGEVIGAIESIRDVSENKAVEEALRASELRFKELSDLLPEAIFETDMNVTITFVNKKAVSLFGYTEQEIVDGINALAMLVPEDQDRAREIIRKRLTGQWQGPIEYTAVKKDGTTFPVIINTVPVMKDGKAVGLRGVVIDITERKRVEEQVRLQAMVLDQIQDLVTVTDLHGNITYVNETEIVSLGYPKGDLIGKNVSFLGEDADKGAGQREIIEKTLANGFWRGEVVNYDVKGREIILDCRTQVVYDGTGKPVAMAGIATDITERKRLEQALEENRLDLRMVVDATDDQILLTDARGVILLYNRVLGEGYKNISDNLVGLNIFDLMSSDNRDTRWRYFKGARESAVACFFEDESAGCTWSSAVYPVVNTSGVVNRLVLFGRDITERKMADQKQKELEERLQRAEKMEALGLLSGGVAHDLNNILGVVLGYSELLVSRIKEESPIKTYAEKVMEASERAAAVIQDMLTLARRGVQNRYTLNLNEVIHDFLKTPEFQNITLLHPKVQVKTQLDTKPLHIMGAPSQLGKTIMNLVANAAEAMPRGGLINITTTNRYLDRPLSGYDEISEGEYVVLSVNDTGEGISEKDINHIFEPFYTRKVMGKSGTGLGLSVVWGTVKDHSGYINVDSTVGVGTTFSLYFPVMREEMVEKKQAIPVVRYMGKGESILVVDDVESQRELVQSMLEKLDYRVTTVPSGEQAVAYLKDQPTDLVVLDMIMDPGMDGLDTYKKIIEIRPQQKAIIVSGYAETARVRQLQALGGGEYVMKPYMLETLGLAVKSELERKTRLN